MTRFELRFEREVARRCSVRLPHHVRVVTFSLVSARKNDAEPFSSNHRNGCPGAGGAASAQAAVQPVAPFQSDYSADFNRFSGVQAVQVLDVFDQTATISNLTDGGAIKIELSSTLNGDLVRPRSGWMMSQLGIGQWDFESPAVQFGGYFENNSGADDATPSFYDANDVLIDAVVADIPVSVSTGHGTAGNPTSRSRASTSSGTGSSTDSSGTTTCRCRTSPSRR